MINLSKLISWRMHHNVPLRCLSATVGQSGSSSFNTLTVTRQCGLRPSLGKGVSLQPLLRNNSTPGDCSSLDTPQSSRAGRCMCTSSRAERAGSHQQSASGQKGTTTSKAAPAAAGTVTQASLGTNQNKHSSSLAEAYEEQLQEKVDRVQDLFADFDVPELEVFRSPSQHYRMRAEFRVWHDGPDMYYVMFEQVDGEQRPRRVRTDTFPAASRLINELMPLVVEGALQEPALRDKLWLVNFHTTLTGQAMVTLVYRRPLDGSWEEAAGKLRHILQQVLGAAEGGVSIIGRSKGQRIDLGQNHVTEVLDVDGRQLKYRQVEGAFSQPNAEVCRAMLGWARDVTRGSGHGDLLELYCGNANFTVALAENFRRVVATEVSKASVDCARHNLQRNSAGNVFVARMSSEDFTSAWQTRRNAHRLEGLEWDALDLRSILVDPPRAGLDEQTVQLLAKFERVVYISCNPDTLRSNLQHISASHHIQRFAVFDQFPFTPHVECGVYLKRQ